MNREEKSASVRRIIYKSTYLTAYGISIGACSGLGTGRMIVTSVLASLFLTITPETAAFPMLLDFLISLFVYNISGSEGAVLSFTIGFVLMLFLRKSKIISANINSDYIRASLGISAAIVMTILITTLYFGIGSTGNTVIEMMKSYRSLGFHPNWRGILYGTMVMVIMITFPRKFKKAGKIVSPEFIGLITTFLLNLWLIPKGSTEFITLLQKSDYSFLKSFMENILDLTPVKAVIVLLSGISIGIVSLIADTEISKKHLKDLAIYNLPAVYTGYIIPGNIKITKNNLIEGMISAIIILILTVPTKGFERLPLSSCAVVLIVSAWENVRWGLIPKSFRTVKTGIAFVVITAATIFITPAAGVLTAFASAILFSGENKNEI